MKEYFEIVDVLGRIVKDLKGNDTIEVEVTLDDGTVGRACVSAQMVDRKDVQLAAENVNTEIQEALMGLNALDQGYIDELLMEIDGEDGKRLGTNATLGASLACCKAASAATGISLYNYIGGVNARKLPEILDESEERRGMKWYPTLTRMLEDMAGGKYEILCAGKTEETIMAHVAVAVGAKKLVCTPVAKNELARIAEELS